jgi:hypothetical protein
LTLTPAAGTVLTFSASTSGKGITQSGSGNHSIKISGVGPATLIPGTTYTVESAASKTGTLEIDTGATLVLAAGALATEDGTTTQSKLVLIGAASNGGAKLIGTNTGSLKAGATTITGTWQAVGTGDVTIASTNTSTSSITASLATVALTTDTTGAGTITQAAGAGNELLIGVSGVKAGALILGAGSWTATNADATIEADKITLGADDDATFGKDDGTAATVLTGTGANTNIFTASATSGTVTLSQSGNALVITGSGTAPTLTTGATAGIKVTNALTITTATVDISAAATSIIALADGSTGITLTNANSIIVLDGDSTTTATAKPITGLTIGAGVEVKAESDDDGKLIGSFTGSTANNTISGSGFDIKKSITTDT